MAANPNNHTAPDSQKESGAVAVLNQYPNTREKGKQRELRGEMVMGNDGYIPINIFSLNDFTLSYTLFDLVTRQCLISVIFTKTAVY
ncbi:hypothetical protein [Pontibacter indicus]|uniref:hypothetical protein n=1 Tax=Pontibacter indicus TaxID=1317125 RepID=UPI0009771721|nr:hypothetical protein [Pontibacter indicus]